MTDTYVRYLPGDTPAIGSPTLAFLSTLADDDARLARVRDSIETGGDADDILDILVSTGLRTLPDFAVCQWTAGAFRIVARGNVEVRPDAEPALPLTIVPWTDGTLHAPAVTLRMLGAEQQAGTPGHLNGLAKASVIRFATGEAARRMLAQDAALQPGADDATIVSPGAWDAPGAAPAAAATGDAPHVEVVAALCPVGHATPAFAPTCRVCGARVPAQEPREIARPTLGVLHLSTGQTVVLDRGAILGRGPSVPADFPVRPGEAEPRLVALPDPNAYVSVQHLEVSLDYWNVVVRDLRSTGGTHLLTPDGHRTALMPGEPTVLPPGASVILAETVTARFDPTVGP